jgi:hypothetical protein
MYRCVDWIVRGREAQVEVVNCGERELLSNNSRESIKESIEVKVYDLPTRR